MRPSSIGSWRMVERSAACAISASSKPSTEMSSGTFSCCLRSSLTSAMATWSVSTQTAVGRSGSDSSFAVSCEARSDLLSGASCASAVSRLNVIPSVALACAASANAGCVGWCCRPCRPECSRCRTRCWYAPESAASYGHGHRTGVVDADGGVEITRFRRNVDAHGQQVYGLELVAHGGHELE